MSQPRVRRRHSYTLYNPYDDISMTFGPEGVPYDQLVRWLFGLRGPSALLTDQRDLGYTLQVVRSMEAGDINLHALADLGLVLAKVSQITEETD